MVLGLEVQVSGSAFAWVLNLWFKNEGELGFLFKCRSFNLRPSMMWCLRMVRLLV